MSDQRIATVALSLLLAALLGFYAVFVLAMAATPVSDLISLYEAARFFWQGKDIYSPVPAEAFGLRASELLQTQAFLPANLNSPATVMLFLSFGLLSYSSVYVIWSIVSIALALVAVATVSIGLGPRSNWLHRTLLLAALLLAYFPTFVAIRLGQVSMLLLLYVVIVWQASRQKRDVAAGIALGLAISLKPFVALLGLLFFIHRRWRLLATAAMSFLVVELAGTAVFGWHAHLTYVANLRSVTWYAERWNASLFGFLTRMFGGSDNVPWIDLPVLAYGLAVAASLLLVTAYLRLARPRQNSSQSDLEFDHAYGLGLVLMLLLSPLGWVYYFSVLILPFAIAWQSARCLAAGYLRTLLITAWLLTSIPYAPILAPQMNDPLDWITFAALPFYGLLILAAVLAFLQLRLSDKAAVATP